jgi:hypothetical protein
VQVCVIFSWKEYHSPSHISHWTNSFLSLIKVGTYTFWSKKMMNHKE